MITTKGLDGLYCAKQRGAMGRMCVAFDERLGEAMLMCRELLMEQANEEYHYSQDMAHFADKRDWGQI